jgi:hypothetical protein
MDREQLERMREKELLEEARVRTLLELAQANGNLRHSRPPLLLLAGRPTGDGGLGGFPVPPEMMQRDALLGSQVPVGLDVGMVRLAMVVAGAGADLAELEKDAGLGQMLGGVGRGLAGLGKGVGQGVAGLTTNTGKGLAAVPGRIGGAFSTGARSAGAGAQNFFGRINQGMNNFGTRAEKGLTSMGERAQSSLSGVGARAQNALSGNKAPDFSVAPKAVTSRTAVPAAPRPAASVGATPSTSSAPAPTTPIPQPGQTAGAPYRQPAPQPAQPSAPKAPPAQAGFLDRMKADLGGGQYKYKLPLLAAGAVGTYGAYRGLKAGLNYLSGESHPYNFNAGAPRLANGVNEYGQAQVGTPFQQ